MTAMQQNPGTMWPTVDLNFKIKRCDKATKKNVCLKREVNLCDKKE